MYSMRLIAGIKAMKNLKRDCPTSLTLIQASFRTIARAISAVTVCLPGSTMDATLDL